MASKDEIALNNVEPREELMVIACTRSIPLIACESLFQRGAEFSDADVGDGGVLHSDDDTIDTHTVYVS